MLIKRPLYCSYGLFKDTMTIIISFCSGIVVMNNEHFLPLMGKNLRTLRKKHYPSDDQKTFAFRIGVGKGTYIKMEKGDLSVSMASYVYAAKLLNVIDGFQALFVQEVDLFKELGM